MRLDQDRWFEAYVLIGLGRTVLAQGDYHEARRRFRAGYAIRETFGDFEGMALALFYEGMAPCARANRRRQTSCLRAAWRSIAREATAAARLRRT